MSSHRSVYHCGVMAAWSRKTLKNLTYFELFWKNNLWWKNCQNSVPKVFIATWIDVLHLNFVKFGQQEVCEIVRCLPDKKISPCSPALATAWIAPKICQDQPQTAYTECPSFHSNRLTFGGVIPERMNTVKTGRKVFPVFSWSLVRVEWKSQVTLDPWTFLASYAQSPAKNVLDLIKDVNLYDKL